MKLIITLNESVVHLRCNIRCVTKQTWTQLLKGTHLSSRRNSMNCGETGRAEGLNR